MVSLYGLEGLRFRPLESGLRGLYRDALWIL